jgi:succinate-semialdehyde dehydrogenase/glutarate-semialdehyde dehydrogenase
MKSEKNLSVFNPADKSLIKEIPKMSAFDIEVAVTNASLAFSQWKKESIQTRIDLLTKIANKIRQEKEALASLLTKEQGKSLAESTVEVEFSASYFDWYASRLTVSNDYVDQLEGGRLRQVTHLPIGVCAAITPWNFPSAMIARKVSAAIAAGCSMLVKPAPDTPLSALEYERIFLECDAPAGLLQIIIADAEDAAKVFFRRNQVRKISFTGSTTVGKELMTKAASQVKRLTLELGGNAPCVVLADADIDIAVRESFFAKFRNGGQTCIAINRILVDESVYDEYVSKFIDKINKIKIGDGSDPSTTLGPLINKSQLDRVTDLVNDALSSGAKILYDGRKDPQYQALKDKGYFYPPMVLEGLIGAHQLWSEEIFGPVAVVYKLNSQDNLSTVIHHANDTKAGLAAYAFSSNKNHIQILKDSLEFGMIGINDCRITAAATPFGGIKESGFGIEGGNEGLLEYQYTNTVVNGSL